MSDQKGSSNPKRKDGGGASKAGGLALAALIAAAPLAAQPTFLSDEIRVDADARSRQRDPIAVSLRDGGSLVVWQEDRHGVFGRLLDGDGEPLGADLALAPSEVATAPFEGVLRLRKQPAAAELGGGGVALAFTQELQLTSSVAFFERRQRTASGVYLSVVRPSAGGALGPDSVSEPVRLDRGRQQGISRAPELAELADGRLLAAWTFELPDGTGGIRARLVSAGGQPIGREVEIDAASDARPGGLTLTAHPNGTALVAWHACCDGGGDDGVFGSVLALDGLAPGPVVRINDLEANDQAHAAAAVLENGEFLVAWQSSTGVPEPIYEGWRVRAQRLAADGTLVGSAAQLSDGIGWGHTNPGLSVGADGGVTLVWLAWVGDVPGAVLARALDAEGAVAGEPFFVSTARTLGAPSITAVGEEGSLVTWISLVDRRRGVSARLLGAASGE